MLRAFFESEHLSEYGVLPFSACHILNEEKAARFFSAGEPVSVCVFLIPYYVRQKGALSRFCAARDYHLYFEGLYARAKAVLPGLLYGGCDNSPVDEIAAAQSAKLGARGAHGLLIHRVFGSYCLIGMFFFDSALPEKRGDGVPELSCGSCGACAKACPTGALDGRGACLSALSQKKMLSEEERLLLKKEQVLWGCDRCQEACFWNREIPETKVSFFREALVCDLSESELDALLESGEFEKRAYAWRGEKVLRRNLKNL